MFTTGVLCTVSGAPVYFNYNLAFFCLFSLSSNAACSSIPCTMSLKMAVLFKDGFILLMYKIWGRKKL